MAEKSKKNIDERKTQQPSGWKGWHVLIPSVAGILGIIIGLMGRPLLDQYILVPNAIVAKINGQSITLQQYETYAKLSRVEEVNYYQRLSQYINLYTQYGMTVSTSLTQQLNQIQTELTDSKTFGQSVLSKMIDNVLLESEAKKLGISVTDDEITKLLQDSFGYYPNGSPTPQTTPTGYIEPTLSGTQQVLLFTPTSTPDLNPTATSTPGEALTATPTMEPTVILPTPTEGPSPTPAPSATPLSLQDYQTAFNTYMSQLTPYGLTEADLRMYVYYQLLYNKVFDEITKTVATHGPQVWVRHILLGTEADAKSALTRLQSGESWIALASELSQDSSSSSYGGDLGWVPQGILTSELDKAAFAMKVGEIQIVQDTNGWHVLQVLGINPDRPLDQTYVSRLQSIAYSDWYTPILNGAKTTTYDIWMTHVPTDPPLPSTSQ